MSMSVRVTTPAKEKEIVYPCLRRTRRGLEEDRDLVILFLDPRNGIILCDLQETDSDIIGDYILRFDDKPVDIQDYDPFIGKVILTGEA